MGGVSVAVCQRGGDRVDVLLVIARPGLVARQLGDPVGDRPAVLVLGLVGADHPQLALAEALELGGDVVRGLLVVVGDRQVLRGRHSAGQGAFGGCDSGDLAFGGVADGVGRTRGGDVVGRLALDVGIDDGLGQLGYLAQDALQHLLLLGENRRGHTGGLVIADRAREPLDRRVRGDLERLSGAGVLGVLEHLLLAAGAAEEIQRRLVEGDGLPNDVLPEADDGHERVRALAERLQAATDTSGVLTRLAEVRLQT